MKAKTCEKVAQIRSLDGALAAVLGSVLGVVQVVDHLTCQLQDRNNASGDIERTMVWET